MENINASTYLFSSLYGNGEVMSNVVWIKYWRVYFAVF